MIYFFILGFCFDWCRKEPFSDFGRHAWSLLIFLEDIKSGNNTQDPTRWVSWVLQEVENLNWVKRW